LELIHFADRDTDFFLRADDLLENGNQDTPWKLVLVDVLRGSQMRIYLLNE